VKCLLISTGFVFTLAVGLPAYGAASPESNQPIMDYASLIKSLRAAGAPVERRGGVDQPFFSVDGKLLKLRGEEVQVFEYPDATAAEAQAALVSPSGSAVGTTRIHWIGPPHFFKKGRLIVLYVGGDGEVLKTLEAVLGRQFAGR